MSYCGCGGTNDYEYGVSGSCVCNKVRDIVAAQDEVAGNNDGRSCSTSCDRSVADLLSPPGNGNRNRNTAIPFALYCKGACGPFVGSGVYQASAGANGSYFGCAESPIFRARSFVEGSDCCVTLELLLPATADGTTPGPVGDGQSALCPFFPGTAITDFQATGICITVDLHNFHSITCLDPVRPLPADDFPASPVPQTANNR